MKESIDRLLEYPIGMTLGLFSVAILELIVFLYCFEFAARYRCWDEIKRGNMAAALATAGKIFGICNIIRYSAALHGTIYDFMIWSFAGTILLFISYILFEFVTPVFRIDREIAEDNRAVGIIALGISVSLSFVIGASLG
ncbi:DUF350 domain-containing protein [Paenibacillus zeisoli]|uniref:DUF350 domain-containing protein n=1 Tax=Paenibacillus zeisoli TaxID=2496267 RepID=A0A3S1D7D0_9BACL|nr:DUF350 domain-containing protein [Paenibacillus zeisoli]RUT28468.1 DUF350 domain-containing protein [Paenibacillus zeisoli]